MSKDHVLPRQPILRLPKPRTYCMRCGEECFGDPPTHECTAEKRKKWRKLCNTQEKSDG